MTAQDIQQSFGVWIEKKRNEDFVHKFCLDMDEETFIEQVIAGKWELTDYVLIKVARELDLDIYEVYSRAGKPLPPLRNNYLRMAYSLQQGCDDELDDTANPRYSRLSFEQCLLTLSQKLSQEFGMLDNIRKNAPAA